jgi:cytochrome d ubiquinol oxidase subunit II
VPLDADGYFFLPLWTDWRVGPRPGILDWYTVLAGVVALAALTLHGANYAVLKTSGELNARARRAAEGLWWAVAAMTAASLAATLAIRPELLKNYQNAPVLYVIPAGVVVSLAAIRWRRTERGAFLSSCWYLIRMLLGAAAALYPNLLVSSGDPSRNLTVFNAHAGEHSLTVGLVWWSLGIAIAIGYFVFVYRMFGGKVSGDGGH